MSIAERRGRGRKRHALLTPTPLTFSLSHVLTPVVIFGDQSLCLMEKQNHITFLLSFIAGFVDTVGFIAVSGIFAAHVTGNIVLAGASVAHFEKSDSVFLKLILIPIFIIGVVLTSRFIAALRYDTKVKLRLLFGVQALMLLLFSFSGTAIIGHWIDDHMVTGTLIQATLAVLAMAVQNTYMKMLIPKFLSTTVMTGNLTNFAVEFGNYLSAIPLRPSTRLIANGSSVFGFVFGSIGGAFGVIELGLFSVLFPVLILIFLAVTKRLK